MREARSTPSNNASQSPNDHFYRAVYDLTPVMMHSMNADGVIVHVNDYWLKVMGHARSDVIGRLGPDFLAQESRDYAQRVGIPKTFEQGFIQNDPIQMVKRNGDVIDVLVSSVIEKSDQGDAVRSYTTLIDVTEQRRAERELQFRNAILKTQQEVSLDGILVVGPDGGIISHNARFADMWRIPQKVLDSKQDERAIQAVLDQLDDPALFLRRVSELYDQQMQSSFDEILLKDGRVFDRYSAPMIGEQDVLYGRVWFFRDVTQQRSAETARRESEDRLKKILESAMDAIITINRHRVIQLFNGSAEKIFRCSAAEAVGTPFDRFASPALAAMLDEYFQGGQFPAADHLWIPPGETAQRADGNVFQIEGTVSQFVAQGEPYGTIILRDVNERQRAEEQLRVLRLEKQLLQEERDAALGFEEIVGGSPTMRKVLRQVHKVAATDATVLILGETGTGKELVARAIHRKSDRADQALVCVNCAALPSGLIESELFGHEKGAFTGALARKIGRFELAAGGSLFLDEIGDLPLDLQAKLLRALQEGEFERLGGTETIRVDVRVIAATHRDLEKLVAEEKFREDLFYRLNVVPLDVPPLRARAGDVELLAKFFAMHYAAKMGKRIDSIPTPTLASLNSHHWPGNVRELQNVIERAVILSEAEELELAQWPPSKRAFVESAKAGRLEDVERNHILSVLEQTGWQISGDRGAARILGLKPTTLQSRMKKLNIQRYLKNSG